MAVQDLFVGAVAGIFGLVLITAAVFDGQWLMQLAHPRMLAESLGKTGARILIGLMGLALIALGVAVASGWRVHWS